MRLCASGLGAAVLVLLAPLGGGLDPGLRAEAGPLPDEEDCVMSPVDESDTVACYHIDDEDDHPDDDYPDAWVCAYLDVANIEDQPTCTETREDTSWTDDVPGACVTGFPPGDDLVCVNGNEPCLVYVIGFTAVC